ncbi:facilitated trehalose transporter Tret1 [Fopius arisanus]|uniref:Facilitated trehalose transporter Tret1 n=1 Tax=Fopius arisanus TaxID=64838 RepID=A0A9R1T0J0_9HYME|nr:PREDICTED: facilitated trehalose transporter Tret1-like [Fopius arisanus]
MSKSLRKASGTWRQYTAAAIINIAAVSTGVSIGWTSPVVPQLEGPTPPVGTYPMTKDQISWLTSIFCIAALIISPVCSVLSEKFGRKILGCLIAIPLGLSWLLTILAQDFSCLLIARIFTGFGGGMTIFLVPIYVAEIATDDVRGKLGSFLLFALSIGILLAFVLGVVMSYQMFAICGMILPIVFISGFMFMPETPIYLLRKCRTKEAERSLMWLRGNDKTAVDREIVQLMKIIEDDSTSARSIGLRDLVRDRGTIKGTLIAFALLPGQQACGNSVVFMYCATIFQLAGSSLSPNASAIVLGVMQLVAAFLSTVTIERVGRRLLLLISCGGMAICHGLLALFFLLQTSNYDLSFFRWTPVIVLCFFTTLYSIGLGPVAFVVATEVLNPEIAALTNSIAMTLTWTIFFTVIKSFPLASGLIGSYGCFAIFSFCCTCTFLITYFLVPETKGKPIEAILRELNTPMQKPGDDNSNIDSIEIK